MITYKILVIDDAFFIRNLIKKAVMKKPIKNDISFEIIGEAQNGNEGLNLVKELHPDIITVDFNIPELNGLDFAKYLKETNPKIPILMISSNTDPTFPQQVEEIGCHFLQKPFQESFLWMRLDTLVEEINNFDESSIKPIISEETKSLLEEISMEVEAEMEEEKIELEEVSLPKANELTNENTPKKKKKKKKKPSNNLFGLEIDDSMVIKPKTEEPKKTNIQPIEKSKTEKIQKKAEVKPIVISTLKEDNLDNIEKNKIQENNIVINSKKDNLNTFIEDTSKNKELDIKNLKKEIDISVKKDDLYSDTINDTIDETVDETVDETIDETIDIEEPKESKEPILSIGDEEEIIIEDDDFPIIIDDEDDTVIVIDDDGEIIIEDDNEETIDDDNIIIEDDIDDLDMIDETFILDDENNLIEEFPDKVEKRIGLNIRKQENNNEKISNLSEKELLIKSLKENVSYSYQNEMSYVLHVIEKLLNNKQTDANIVEESSKEEVKKTNNLGMSTPIIREEDLTKEDEDAEFDKLFAEFNPNLDLSNITKKEDKIHEKAKESLLQQAPSITQNIEIEPPKSEKVRQIYKNGKQETDQFVIPIDDKPKKVSIFTKIFNFFIGK